MAIEVWVQFIEKMLFQQKDIFSPKLEYSPSIFLAQSIWKRSVYYQANFIFSSISKSSLAFALRILNYMLKEYWKLHCNIQQTLSPLTFVPLVPGLALRARLISILPFIFIARPADRESTNIASNERIAIHIVPNIITTDLADFATQCFHWLCLHIWSDTKMCH